MKTQLDEETQKILDLCSVSTEMTAKVFFPERFKKPFASLHKSILTKIDNDSPRVVIAAPRGYGKTSIVALALAARHIIFNITPFVVYINKSFDAACLHSENLRRELATNAVIKDVFGPLRPKRVDTEFEEVFSKKAWVAYKTLLFPRGTGQQVRGVLYKNDRPGLIILDDIEDGDEINSEEYRKKTKYWFYSEVMNAVAQDSRDWKIVYIDTLKHEDALLQELLESKDWDSERFEACDDNFIATVPSFKNDEDIKELWEYFQNLGQTDVFFREFRNLPISTIDASFKQDMFKYYNCLDMNKKKPEDLDLTEEKLTKDKSIENVIIVDPAKTVKTHSAESAIINVGMDLNNGRYFVRDIISEKFYPDQLYDAVFNMAQRTNSRAIGIEETSLNEFIKQPIKNEMSRRGSFYELVWLKARGGMKKEERIKELVPYYRRGYIYHNASCPATKRLEAQLLMFPRSKLWDIMDCLAYLIEMSEIGGRYLSSKDFNNDPELDYLDLTYDDEPLGDWRRL